MEPNRNSAPVRATGIVLAGGSSRRMGRDKALVPVAGRPMIEHVLSRLAEVCDEVLIASAPRPEYSRFGVPVVPDRPEGQGSLGGIWSGLGAAHNEYAMVVACDMPLLNPELLRYMLACARGYDVVIPQAADPSKPEYSRRAVATAKDTDIHPLHAVYARTCLPAMEQALARGDLRVISFYDQVRVRLIGEAEIDTIDPRHLSFFNANTPDELAFVEEALRGEIRG